jgi:hypothetical protein
MAAIAGPRADHQHRRYSYDDLLYMVSPPFTALSRSAIMLSKRRAVSQLLDLINLRFEVTFGYER